MPRIDNGKITLQVGAAAVEPYRLVKTPAGVVHNTETSTDEPLGSTEYGAAAEGRMMVRLLSDPGLHMLEASGAIAAGAKVFADDDGKIQALPETAGTYRRIGTAMEAATVDGDVIPVLPYGYNTTETVSSGE